VAAGTFEPAEGATVLDVLRDEYRQATGTDPDNRWRENRLRNEITAAEAATETSNADETADDQDKEG
jgi:hypothetical protein